MWLQLEKPRDGFQRRNFRIDLAGQDVIESRPRNFTFSLFDPKIIRRSKSLSFDFQRNTEPQPLEVSFVALVFSGSLQSRPSFSSSGMILNLRTDHMRPIH